jgi:N-carbamoylputrescine amidase
MKRVGFVEWPDGLDVKSAAWAEIKARVADLAPDILVTNEMPFGEWLPVDRNYSEDAARHWADLHERGLDALRELRLPAIVSSRPVPAGNRLANEAFTLEDGGYRILHHKHYFPAEPGWEEAEWFRPSIPGFTVNNIGGLSVGVLLCTELMFNEKARLLGKQGADLIAAPRAAGTSTGSWRIAAAMASLASGSYLVSSNRSGQASRHSPAFGGVGFAYAPGGEELASTSPQTPLVVIDVDTARTKAAKLAYPCYVPELEA